MTGERDARRVALVTGGSRGIGRAIVRRLSDDGVEVATCSRQPSGPGAGEVWHAPVDLADLDAIPPFLAALTTRFGRLDILVNNAAFASEQVTPIERESEETTRRTLVTNVLAPISLVRRLLPALRASPGGGAVVNLASRAGLAPIPGLASYSASKSALLSWTLAAAKEEKDSGVFFATICPAGVATEMRGRLYGSDDATRQLTPERVAAVVAELALHRTADARPTRSGGAVLLTIAGGARVLEWLPDERGVETLNWR